MTSSMKFLVFPGASKLWVYRAIVSCLSRWRIFCCDSMLSDALEAAVAATEVSPAGRGGWRGGWNFAGCRWCRDCVAIVEAMLRSSSRSSIPRWRALLSLMDWMDAGTCGTLWAGSCWRCRVSRIAERVACWLAMMVTRASIFVSIGLGFLLSGEGLVARLIKVDDVGGSAVDLDEIESESRRRDCSFSTEMTDLWEVVEPVLRL